MLLSVRCVHLWKPLEVLLLSYSMRTNPDKYSLLPDTNALLQNLTIPLETELDRAAWDGGRLTLVGRGAEEFNILPLFSTI